MAKLPVTAYLLRAELAKLDELARAARLTRSTFLCNAIRSKLADQPNAVVGDEVGFLRAAVQELIGLHPDAAAIRARSTGATPKATPN
ncbi:MAG: ribbon-helix-helix protein, CopG family [Sphingopyxis sp.]|nr:ribbon-helix-helix protein, CopG family [Sphingopyxis sp.]